MAIAAPNAGSRRLAVSRGQRHREPVHADRARARPRTGHVHGSAVLHVPSASAWTSWRTVPVTLTMAAGTNLVVCSVESPDQGGVNLDYVALA